MGQDTVNLAAQIAALPLQAILIIGIATEGVVIRALWSKMNDVQSRLDECLGKSKQ